MCPFHEFRLSTTPRARGPVLWHKSGNSRYQANYIPWKIYFHAVPQLHISYGANSRPKKPEAEILMKKRWENAPVRSGAARIVTVALGQSVTLVTILVVFSAHAGSIGDHCCFGFSGGGGHLAFISMTIVITRGWGGPNDSFPDKRSVVAKAKVNTNSAAGASTVELNETQDIDSGFEAENPDFSYVAGAVFNPVEQCFQKKSAVGAVGMKICHMDTEIASGLFNTFRRIFTIPLNAPMLNRVPVTRVHTLLFNLFSFYNTADWLNSNIQCHDCHFGILGMPEDKDQHLALSTVLRVTSLSSTSTSNTAVRPLFVNFMFSLDSDSRSLHITGGHGGSGGPAHLQGGTGGVGEGPIVHITTSQLITHNLQATVATDRALQLRNIRAAQIASHCPPPSRVFCGREDILNKMHQFFSDTGIQHIYVLHGLGGAGKTQIALKFINESSFRFSDIFFIDTSTIATIETGLKNIAILKDFGESPEDGLLWLTSKAEEWLLFFDNADDPGINLNDHIPQCNHGNIIITSRNPGMCVYAGSNSLVSDMEEEDAVTLLLKSALQRATSRTEQIAAEIVKSLHYLPLAIVQAGAFILKSRNLDGYLALYMENQAQLLSEKPAQSHDCYGWTVYTTWQMSFDRLTPPAAMFLQHCSFLHYNGISEEIFRYASRYRFPFNGPSKEEVQEPLEFLSHFLRPTGEWDSLQFLNATNEIQSYSLISFDAQKKLFFIHPLVHAWSQATVQNPKRHVSIMGSILGMAISQCSQWDMQLASMLLCPHIELALQMNAEVALSFQYQYALIFLEEGNYKCTEKLLEEVLQKQKQVLGGDHPGTLQTVGNLASSYSDLGEHQRAQELQVMVLEKQTHLLGDDHPDTLQTMGNLASSYSDLGEHQKAKELKSVVLEKRKQVLGENHPHTLHAMRGLASSYSNLGEHQKAKELEIIVVKKWTEILGQDHPHTLLTMGNLASSYSDLGEHQKAKELQSLVLEKQTRLLGADHPNTLLTMGNLASSYSNLGEHQKAKELKSVVLQKRKKVLGENHPHTLHAMHSLASSYSDLGEHQKAKELKSVVLEKRKQVLGDKHPDVLEIEELLDNHEIFQSIGGNMFSWSMGSRNEWNP
ncbi:hypothetical protein B0H16DRAFT_1458827 [Mycena metata]|uniref:Nephrocystin-3 n=1 Tax=Mycena metata TaxID=1033252 RepID=A0AAD7J114_9AGAR|nr:hypothetical protein B0H16DRAFT_1458827 [Mycena metata]